MEQRFIIAETFYEYFILQNVAKEKSKFVTRE